MISSLFRNWQIINTMIRRDISGRYKGSLAGVAWAVVNPILMLAIYTFVFSVVFNARWKTDAGSKADFAIVLFCGLIIFSIFAECVNRAPGLIAGHANYVKKIVFPLETLVWVIMGTAVFHALVSLGVLFAAELLLYGRIPWTAILLPLVIIPCILLTVGVSWFVASIAVFVKDFAQITAMFTTVLMFLSPLFFPISAVPEKYQSLLLINPMAMLIQSSRETLIYGVIPSGKGLLGIWVLGLVVAWLGHAWFMKTKMAFADVL